VTELNAEVEGAADAVAASTDWAAPAASGEWGAAPSADWGDASGEAPAPPGEEGAAAPADGAQAERKPRYNDEEEEDNTLTYEQYQAKQKEAMSEILPAKLEARKVEDTEIKGTVISKADQDEAYFAGKVCKP
jgi:plasminogen activator inhibitor 1 RNA-binding protein